MVTGSTFLMRNIKKNFNKEYIQAYHFMIKKKLGGGLKVNLQAKILKKPHNYKTIDVVYF